MAFSRRHIGHGIGLRPRHYGEVLAGTLRADWFEVISENFFLDGGRPMRVLERARETAPVVLHGVSLSIGSVDPLNRDYLRTLRALADRVEPAWVSDHLCWGGVGGHYAHDLLPLPYTEEAVAHVAGRVTEVQEALGRPILLENVSSYVGYRDSEMPEWEFVADVARRAGCGILLDVNNVLVSARNHGFDPEAYLRGVPGDAVGQVHVAGHTDKRRYLFDSHIGPVPESVWRLFASAVRRFGPLPSLVEWDEEVPDSDVLLAQARRAAEVESQALEGGRAIAG